MGQPKTLGPGNSSNDIEAVVIESAAKEYEKVTALLVLTGSGFLRLIMGQNKKVSPFLLHI